eukprot:Nk52_evm21s1524 gene=Nk52_evmTU21s1524
MKRKNHSPRCWSSGGLWIIVIVSLVVCTAAPVTGDGGSTPLLVGSDNKGQLYYKEEKQQVQGRGDFDHEIGLYTRALVVGIEAGLEELRGTLTEDQERYVMAFKNSLLSRRDDDDDGWFSDAFDAVTSVAKKVWEGAKTIVRKVTTVIAENGKIINAIAGSPLVRGVAELIIPGAGAVLPIAARATVTMSKAFSNMLRESSEEVAMQLSYEYCKHSVGEIVKGMTVEQCVAGLRQCYSSTATDMCPNACADDEEDDEVLINLDGTVAGEKYGDPIGNICLKDIPLTDNPPQGTFCIQYDMATFKEGEKNELPTAKCKTTCTPRPDDKSYCIDKVKEIMETNAKAYMMQQLIDLKKLFNVDETQKITISVLKDNPTIEKWIEECEGTIDSLEDRFKDAEHLPLQDFLLKEDKYGKLTDEDSPVRAMFECLYEEIFKEFKVSEVVVEEGTPGSWLKDKGKEDQEEQEASNKEDSSHGEESGGRVQDVTASQSSRLTGIEQKTSSTIDNIFVEQFEEYKKHKTLFVEVLAREKN